MKFTKNLQKGFTLVELLIVVIILAILAAIVVPQFSSSTDDAKSSAVETTLANMRSAIDLYYQQHGSYPAEVAASGAGADCTGTASAAALDTEAAFLDQLALYTNASGQACNIKNDAQNLNKGPYLKKRAVPLESITETQAIVIVDAAHADRGKLDMTADAGDPGGWKYDPSTGKFIMNHTSYDDL